MPGRDLNLQSTAYKAETFPASTVITPLLYGLGVQTYRELKIARTAL